MENPKRLIVKEEFVMLTKDTIEAIILDQFIHWTKKNNNEWICKKTNNVKKETLITDSEKTVRRKIQSIVEKGFLQERENPENKWDKILQYKVNFDKITDELKKIGYDQIDCFAN